MRLVCNERQPARHTRAKGSRGVFSGTPFLKLLGAEEPLSVLVVDDEPAGLRILQEALADLDCKMLVARSGDRALEITQRVRPSVILLDVVMDGLDGFATCRRIKSDPAMEASVVIFLSAKTDLSSRLEGLESGGIDYIAKPYSADEVRAKVVTHLENARLRNELELRNLELDQAYQKQNQLLGMAAHDLRTPITAILLAAKTLRRGKLTPSQQLELLEIVETSSQHMQGLIEDLLDMSALQSSEVAVHLAEGCLNELISERLRLHQYTARNKEIAIRVELESLPRVRFDHQKMGQVVDNLVSNAIKYSHPGSGIGIATRVLDGSVELEVSDHGVGIAPADLPRVFEPFAKLGSRPTQGESSHGLGLTIARNIVRGHQGEITAVSTPGEGTRFRVRLKV